MRIQEVLIEAPAMFSAVLIHETTPESAKSIRKEGFLPTEEGVFFGVNGTTYMPGDYGGVEIQAKVSGPNAGILNAGIDGNLPEYLSHTMDYIELAEYARRKGFWAWTDEFQFVVLDVRHIKVLRILSKPTRY